MEIEVSDDASLDRAGETVAVEVDESDSILAAARSQGLWLPADCQQGWCVTCAAKLLAGEVDQSNAKRYYDVDEAAGFVLPCIAKPQSDCRILALQHDDLLDHRAAHDLPPGRSKR